MDKPVADPELVVDPGLVVDPELVVDPALIAALRKDLRQAGFYYDQVNSVMGSSGAAALLREERVPALRAARQRKSALAILTRLFVLWDVVDEEDVATSLPSLGVQGVCALGLAQRVDGGLHGTVQLQPHAAVIEGQSHEWWIASDLGEGLTRQGVGRDHVLGIGGATRTLLQMTPREPVASALDLGTGCGVLALYLATHAKHVVATDVSERAVTFARFNFALNEADIEVRLGSLYDPVAEETFDLIVSNPPFVITPDSLRGEGTVTYRDGGAPGDELVGAVVTGARAHLRPGGRAFFLANWEIEHADEPEAIQWQAHPRRWVEEAQLSAWVVQREQLDPAQYVQMWMADNGAARSLPPAQYESDFALWLEDFHQRGIHAVGLGFIAIENPNAPSAPSPHLGVRGSRQSVLNEDAIAAHPHGSATHPHGSATHPHGLAAPQRQEGSQNRVADVSEAEPVHVFEEVNSQTTATGSYIAATMTELFNHPDVGDPSITDEVVFQRALDVREERHFEPGQVDPQLIVATQGDGFGRRITLNTSMSAVLGASDGELSVGQIITALHVLTDEDEDVIRERVYTQLPLLVRAGMLKRRPD